MLIVVEFAEKKTKNWQENALIWVNEVTYS